MHVVGFAGFSGAGKTTLVEQLVAAFRQRGLRVSVVKHAHHSFDLDQPGKDTYRHRTAGALEVVVASSKRLALLRELKGYNNGDLSLPLTRAKKCGIGHHMTLARSHAGPGRDQ